MSPSRLAVLQDYIETRIPLTRHLAFRLLEWEESRLRMQAPLDANINDKGTMFAGSQAALLSLAGWALTTLLGEQARGAPVDVVAVESALRYLAPLDGDTEILVEADEEALRRFRERLAERGRARLRITAVARRPDGTTAAEYEASYLAR